MEAVNITKSFGSVQALEKVSLSIRQGETLGLVGESGCGKSTLGRILLGLIPPSGGSVLYKGKELFSHSKEEQKRFRKELQIIFQDPTASLNPRFRTIDTLSEPLHIHAICRKEKIESHVEQLLRKVGLDENFKYRYPHELSGGEKQRIGIARALATEPEFIVADEPVSSLDVSVQAQILELLHTLQKTERLTMLFISHDLNIVRLLCDRIAVMYFGKLVELASTEELFNQPKHPYTQTLLAATL